MTGKQIKALRDTIRGKDWRDLTPEQRTMDTELDCREMINSCLCYGSIRDFWRENYRGERYCDRYVRALGMTRVRELSEEQEADFAKARVLHDVFTDSEGCTYNSIVWEDDR